MLYFILGVFFGALVMFAARLADKSITPIIERYGKTGSLVKPSPTIIEAEDPTDKFIKENFDVKQ